MIDSKTFLVGSLQLTSSTGVLPQSVDWFDSAQVFTRASDVFSGVVNDHIVRVVTTTAHGTHFAAYPTNQFASALHALLAQKDADIFLLKDIAKWQKKRLDYQGIYNAYLLEAIDEDEFVAEADKYATEFKTAIPEQIRDGMIHINGLLGFQLDQSDFADYFGVEVNDVILATNLLNSDGSGVIPLLGAEGHLDADS